MIVKDGKIIAIDYVVRDKSLTGDGTSASPLGVNGNVSTHAGDWATITGKYTNDNFSYGKPRNGGTIVFSPGNGLKLSADSVYAVTTDISFKPTAATPAWYDMAIKVGDQVHNFSVDGANIGVQTFSFTQIENCSANKVLPTSADFYNIGSASMVQSVHDIVGVSSGGSPGPTPTPTSTMEIVLEDDNGEVSTHNLLASDTGEFEIVLESNGTSASYNLIEG
jgi:hypothetical protein